MTGADPPRNMLRQPADLDALYAAPKERSLRKELPGLDRHARAYIALSPFVVLATADAEGRPDASPRGGDPGFVQVLDAQTLLLPDSPGNNRLDTLRNVAQTGGIGLLFMIPGVDETLRVNGRAVVSVDPADIARGSTERRAPKTVLRVSVEAVYLHCAKAFMRSKLWSDAARIERSRLPSMGQMLAEQIGQDGPTESQEDMVRRYAADL